MASELGYKLKTMTKEGANNPIPLFAFKPTKSKWRKMEIKDPADLNGVVSECTRHGLIDICGSMTYLSRAAAGKSISNFELFIYKRGDPDKILGTIRCNTTMSASLFRDVGSEIIDMSFENKPMDIGLVSITFTAGDLKKDW